MRQIGVGTWVCSPRERELVNRVLDSGRLSYGPMSREFEKEFATTHSVSFGVLSNSGTSSLQVALQAMKELHGWKDGDEIIVPAVTFVATINVILHNRLTPVLVDVNPRTYNIDMPLAMNRITPKTRAIMPVHLFGQPADMSYLSVFRPARIKVIEDACEAAFATLNGRPVGWWSDIACFSFYVAHLLTTGVGGMSITDDPEYAMKMRSLVNHGRDGIYFDIDTEATTEVISKRFKFDSVGHSYRVTELEAAIGLAQLENWRSMVAKRTDNAAWLTLNLQNLDTERDLIQLPKVIADAKSSWMMYPIVVKHESKWGLVNHLEGHGIETREMMPLTNQPCYKNMWKEDDYPVAKWINESGFYIACHQDLTEDDLVRIADAFYEYFK